MSINSASLNELIKFIPSNGFEADSYNKLNKEVLDRYLSDTKQRWSDGKFYLYGQVKISLDEQITLEKINQVREINTLRLKECPPCNSFEIASVATHERLFNDFELILKTYIRICNNRIIIKELSKCKELTEDNIINITNFI